MLLTDNKINNNIVIITFTRCFKLVNNLIKSIKIQQIESGIIMKGYFRNLNSNLIFQMELIDLNY